MKTCTFSLTCRMKEVVNQISWILNICSFTVKDKKSDGYGMQQLFTTAPCCEGTESLGSEVGGETLQIFEECRHMTTHTYTNTNNLIFTDEKRSVLQIFSYLC